MKDTQKKDERKAKLKEVDEQELQRVMGGALGCGECLCGGGSGASRESLSDCRC